MKLKPPQTLETDVLIIGGGGAGLRAAIEARKYNVDVLIVSKSRVGYGNNTAISGAGFAAATGIREPQDTPEVYLKDTIVAGRFLNNQRLVEVLAEGSSQQVYDLVRFGARFRRRNGGFLIVPVPGHTYPRHVSGAKPLGTDFTLPLRQYALNEGVKFAEGILITRLLKHGEMVNGAWGLDGKGNVYAFNAKTTILAAAGMGEIFLRTNNAPGATGDGYALAYQAGVPLQDMEFVQFYPTGMGKTGKQLWGYEIFLSRGATLRNSLGEDVLERHGIKDFMVMTRDMLTRAIMFEILEGRDISGTVAADLSSIPADRRERLDTYIREQRHPEKPFVAPTTHFMMGGSVIDESCQTVVQRLYAAGEVCGGVHGANRLAGNALTEVFVFGTIAGNNAAQKALDAGRLAPSSSEIKAEMERLESWGEGGSEDIHHLHQSLRETMWYKAGIIRSRDSLEEALEQVCSLKERAKRAKVTDYSSLIQAVKLDNMILVSEMIIRAALQRTESRGAHYRTDYPEENNNAWLKNIVISRTDEGMALSTVPVALSKMAPQRGKMISPKYFE